MLTPFQQRCYAVVATIPAGKAATYGDVAASLGSCARAVGQCMKKNLHAPAVP
jgi:methylated-DNA-[protein]-cysteine S-methyltransferase